MIFKNTSIAIFWNNPSPEEFDLAEEVIYDKQKDFVSNFQSVITCAIFPKSQITESHNMRGLSHKITCESYDSIVDALNAAFQFAKMNRISFGIFSNSATLFLDGYKLKKLFEQDDVQSKAFSLRVGEIKGKALKFSARFPFIDDNFIIFNVKRCDELGVFDSFRLKNFTSHFEEWGGNHASLFSFFEACVHYGDIYIYSDGSDCQGLYGDRCNFYPTTYLYSHQYGLLSSNPRIDSMIHSLRAELLHQSGFSEAPGLKEYIVKHKITSNNFYFDQNIPFLKEKVLNRITKKLIEKGRKFFGKISYEFKRNWNDYEKKYNKTLT